MTKPAHSDLRTLYVLAINYAKILLFFINQLDQSTKTFSSQLALDLGYLAHAKLHPCNRKAIVKEQLFCINKLTII
jgi:hypothetical protein